QLHLLGVVAHAPRQAVEDPLADLAFVLGVHGDETAREGRDLVESVAGIGHAADTTGAVAGEAAALRGYRPAALDAADVLAPPVPYPDRDGNQHDRHREQHALRPAHEASIPLSRLGPVAYA